MATVIQWLIDTRPLFPSAKQTSDLPQAAARAMALLAPPEAAAVLRYHFLADAKLALLSALLKRLAIAQLLGVPWARATPVRDAHAKPVFYWNPGSPGLESSEPQSQSGGGEGLESGGPQPLLFNVSHQAGVVVLLAALRAPAPRAALGIDIVCPPERRARDLRTIRGEGWAHFVGMHEDVFAASEARRLRGLRAGPAHAEHAEHAKEPEGTKDLKYYEGSEESERARLEHFYALWCLREAWVKMTGEALLAPWLGELEMRNWAPPPPPPPAGPSASTSISTGTGTQTQTQTQTQAHDDATDADGARLEVWFRGQRVDDVSVRLERWAGAYMIATAVRGEGIALGPFEELRWEDVLARAEALRARG
ncbi:L-aminoadipate-semialdehyde dehydrogenase-phosphopantetheinyl transferase [Escovopsis weberi]|uniref:holo-[acyl-carrier-protein] synthase n=1 Tax=Escovopsis weberi TaxID=150374 RepID=A0A0M9VVN4_ESCWE|nr:L-aminoadipate-semialdehyde dehydrogenase-phosphopantetheinyl transferase [Escovopsis weberi]